MSAFAAAGLASGLLAACGGSTNGPLSAAQLMAQNAGALLGGHTIVGTADGQRLVAGSTPDTVYALGPNETVVGGSGPDQMGAFASNVTIIGGTRSSVIYGGPNATLVSGSAPDLLVDYNNDGTVRLTGDGNEVMLAGSHDHVLCSPTSHNDVIYENRSDSVGPTCVANNARVLSARNAPATAQLAADELAQGSQGGNQGISAGQPTGTGKSDAPYVNHCDNPSDVDCTVSNFFGIVVGVGKAYDVPYYQCPTDHPWLLRQNFAPFGTTIPRGVEIRQSESPWAINVYIGFAIEVDPPATPPKYAMKTFGNPAGLAFAAGAKGGPGDSGATNWTNRGASYQIVLHCTNNPDNTWYTNSLLLPGK